MEIGVSSSTVVCLVVALIVATGHEKGTANAASTAAPTQSAAKTTTGTPKPTIAEEFHVIVIVMIVILGFVVIFSILCGCLTLHDVDINCPLPCCCQGKAAVPLLPPHEIPLKHSTAARKPIDHDEMQHPAQFEEVICRVITKTEQSGDSSFNAGYSNTGYG